MWRAHAQQPLETAQQHLGRGLAEAEKPSILKAYLDGFRREVQRFFPVAAGAPVDAFAAIASRYPAFELVRR